MILLALVRASRPMYSCFDSEKQNPIPDKNFRLRDPESDRWVIEKPFHSRNGLAGEGFRVILRSSGTIQLRSERFLGISTNGLTFRAISPPLQLPRPTFPRMHCGAEWCAMRQTITQRAPRRRRTLGLHFPSARSGSAGSPPRPSLCGSY